MEGNESEPLPDDLRCNRSDGRHWRCKLPSLPGKSFCGSHLYRSRNTRPKPSSPPRLRVLVKSKAQPTPQPGEPVPDHLRCTRNDGRSWRCKKRALEGQSFCGPHLIKLHSQYQKQKERKRKKKLPLAIPLVLPPSPSDSGGVTLVGSHAEEPEQEKSNAVLALAVVESGQDRKKSGSTKRMVREGGNVFEFHLNDKKCKNKKNSKETPKREEKVVGDRKMEGGGGEESGGRCKRTDGRGWFCKRRVLEGKTLCEIHYKQGRLRQMRVTVPESLKIKRGCGDGDKVEKRTKKKRALEDLENNSDKGMKRMKAELIRVFLRREIIESSKKSEKATESSGGGGGGEVTRDLPYGLMAIPPPPTPTPQFLDNAGSLGIKVGGTGLKSTVNRRFRSKNIEPPPISTLKVVPYVGKNLGKVKSNGKNKCHWCQLGEDRMLTKCKTCKKKFFCSDCIKERSFDEQEVEKKCPVCSESCNCMGCLAARANDVGTKEVVERLRKGSKHETLQYLIKYLLPVLEQINQEQSFELEMEAKLKGQDLSEVEIQLADVGCSDRCCCNNCKNPILDFHRSCPNCSYNLCLSCCQEYSRSGTLRDVGISTFQIHNSTKAQFSLKGCSEMQQNHSDQSVDNGNVAATNSMTETACLLSCPPIELGGCDGSLLDLRCIFPLNWTKELEISAKEIVPQHESSKVSDEPEQCILCDRISAEVDKSKEIQEAFRRKESGDNLVYCPSSSDDRDDLFVHFQKHWQKGQPVKVRNMLHGVPDIRWDPLDMFTSYLEKSSSNCENEIDVVNYSDWYNVEIGTKDSFIGCTGDRYTHTQRKTLKLMAQLSSALSRKLFEDHYHEIICSLPLEEYTNSNSGLLNLAGKLPEEFPDYKLGPHVCISCGSREEISRGELVTRLCYHSNDVVNVLVHAGDVSCSTEQINKIRKLIKQNNVKDKGGCVENEETRMQSGISVKAGVAAASCNSAATNAACVNCNDDKSPIKVHCSDSDSDASMICSGISDTPEKAVDQISCRDPVASSSLSHNTHLPEPCGAQWDVFRRQDIPKLLQYIADHVDELSYGYDPLKVVHPIFDGSFYLDASHKMRLKAELDIEPWTFDQYLGDAVFIPAGCAYQKRNIKSCVSIGVGFVSPESVSECIKLGDEIRILPVNHRAKQNKLEVEKMAICSLDEAMKEMYRLKSMQHDELDG